MASRRTMAMRNVFSGLLYYLSNAIIGFVSRKVFTIYLGKELLGLNGLVVSVIAMLSLLELGIASSIGFSLYKPIADNDEGQIKAIMRLYARLYRAIGVAVAVIGLILIPFLPMIIRSTIDFGYITAVYLLFLADAVLSYFMAYRRTLLVSAQKDYITKNADTILYIITGIAQIAIICIWKSYIISLVVKLVFTVINNLILYLLAGKLFPCLTRNDLNEEIPPEVKKKITDNVKALFIIKIAAYCVTGTDNILLTAFAGLGEVAIYSGYLLIIGIINNLFNKSFGYMTANVGNYLVTNDSERTYDLFENLNFINYLITSYTCIAMFTLFNDFIEKVWLSAEYIFPMTVVAILMFNNYSRYCTQALETFRSAAGLFSPKPFVKYIALLEGGINLAASVLLAHTLKLGVIGVFLGTSISTLVTTIVVPWIVYRFLFHKPLRMYYKRYILYLILAIAGAGISAVLFHLAKTSNGYINVVIGGCISLAVPVVINFVLFGRTKEWRYMMDIVKGLVRRIV